jgi:hypothetical protein
VQIIVSHEHCGLDVRGPPLRAVLGHIYSGGVFLPVRPLTLEEKKRARAVAKARCLGALSSDRMDTTACMPLEDVVELREAAEGGMHVTADWKVDDVGVLEAYALADLWCLEDLKAAYQRYIDHTWAHGNAVDRLVS